MGVDKHDWKELAIFGGTPSFAEPLHVGRPNIGSKERLFSRIEDLLSRRWLSNEGPFVRDLEERIARWLGVEHCVVTCNGTIALEIAARALGLTGEVIVPSFTFIATAHALRWLGLTPVFCDVDPRTHNIDPVQAERAVTPRTSGVIGVHLWGRPCDVRSLSDVAARHGLQLMFDAAHAFACSHRGRMIGHFGRLEVFSFHATKFFNSFEGGAIVTNDAALAGKARAMKDFGFSPKDQVISVGTNGKMTEVAAAMGLTGLECLEQFIEANRLNYQCYMSALSDLPGVSPVSFEESEQNNYQYLILEIDEERYGMSRDQLMRILHAERILARRYFYPGCHRMEPYLSSPAYSGLRLPVTESLADRVLALPTGTAVGRGEVEAICGIVRLVAKQGRQIGRALSGATAQAGEARKAL